jgi:hypothetical protein
LISFRKRRHIIGFATLLTLFLMLSAVAFSPVYADVTPHPADAMWIEPPANSYDSSTVVGTEFNVTVWLNMTTPTNAWQFFLVYNSTQLQALDCEYTGVAKSLWAGKLATVPVTADFEPLNTTYSYVVFSEVLKNKATQTGADSLAWVEFNITYVPPQGLSVSTGLLLDQTKPFKVKVLAADGSMIPVTLGNGSYYIPEFPLTTLLVALFALASSIALIFRKTLRQKINNGHSCRL